MLPHLGIPELLVILFIIILIFGANRLPDIGRGIHPGIERKQRGETFGSVSSRHDLDGPLAHGRDLARGEDDIRVVRKEQDLPGGDCLYGLQQLTGARVRRLTALDHRCDPEVAEDRGQSVHPARRQPPAGRWCARSALKVASR